MWRSWRISDTVLLALVGLVGVAGGCFDGLVDRTSCTVDSDCYAGETCLDGQCYVRAVADGTGEVSGLCHVCTTVTDASGGAVNGAMMCTDQFGGDTAIADASGAVCLDYARGPQVGVVVTARDFVSTRLEVDLTVCEQTVQLDATSLVRCDTPPCGNPCLEPL